MITTLRNLARKEDDSYVSSPDHSTHATSTYVFICDIHVRSVQYCLLNGLISLEY